MEDAQQEEIRYWVNEASRAVRNIALIRSFDERRSQYICSKPNPEDLKNPIYDPVGRTSVSLISTAEDALILFSWKAFDADKRSASISKLKNAILCDPDVNGDYKEHIRKKFKEFSEKQTPIKENVALFRKK